jgi:hypothetical protein
VHRIEIVCRSSFMDRLVGTVTLCLTPFVVCTIITTSLAELCCIVIVAVDNVLDTNYEQRDPMMLNDSGHFLGCNNP